MPGCSEEKLFGAFQVSTGNTQFLDNTDHSTDIPCDSERATAQKDLRAYTAGSRHRLCLCFDAEVLPCPDSTIARACELAIMSQLLLLGLLLHNTQLGHLSWLESHQAT